MIKYQGRILKTHLSRLFQILNSLKNELILRIFFFFLISWRTSISTKVLPTKSYKILCEWYYKFSFLSFLYLSYKTKNLKKKIEEKLQNFGQIWISFFFLQWLVTHTTWNFWCYIKMCKIQMWHLFLMVLAIFVQSIKKEKFLKIGKMFVDFFIKI